MIRLGMLSFWHVPARNYAKQVREHPDTEIVGTEGSLLYGRPEAQLLL